MSARIKQTSKAEEGRARKKGPRPSPDSRCIEDFSRFYDDISAGETDQTVSSPLDEEDLHTLKCMVEAFKAHRIDFSRLPRRPKFRGPTINSGIRINAEIKRRVLERVKADPDGTGGGHLNGLIEVLLWMFLGCPTDVLDRDNRKNP